MEVSKLQKGCTYKSNQKGVPNGHTDTWQATGPHSDVHGPIYGARDPSQNRQDKEDMRGGCWLLRFCRHMVRGTVVTPLNSFLISSDVKDSIKGNSRTGWWGHRQRRLCCWVPLSPGAEGDSIDLMSPVNWPEEPTGCAEEAGNDRGPGEALTHCSSPHCSAPRCTALVQGHPVTKGPSNSSSCILHRKTSSPGTRSTQRASVRGRRV